RRFVRGELLLALLELGRALLEVGTEGHVALGVGDLRLEPVELRLAGGKLGLAPIELGRPRGRVANRGGLVRVLAFERLELAAEALLLEQQLGLALAQRLVLGRDAGALLLEIGLAGAELALPLRDLLVTRAALLLPLRERAFPAFELDGAGALLRGELLLGEGKLSLPVRERLALLLEVVRELRAVTVEGLQLAQLPLGLL